MSWSEPRRAVLAALAAGLAACLAACGFTPLYAPGSPAAGMGGRVEVAVVEGAPGFAMREELTSRLGPATAATHRLDVTLALEQTGVALTQQDVTTRYNVTGTAGYALVPLAGGPPVASGTVRAITGYSAPEFGDRLGLREPRGAARRRAAAGGGARRPDRAAAGAVGRRLDVRGLHAERRDAPPSPSRTRHPPARRAAARPRAAEKRPPGGRSAAARARGPGGTAPPVCPFGSIAPAWRRAAS